MKNDNNSSRLDRKAMYLKLKEFIGVLFDPSAKLDEYEVDDHAYDDLNGGFIEDQPGWVEGMDKGLYDFVDDNEGEELEQPQPTAYSNQSPKIYTLGKRIQK